MKAQRIKKILNAFIFSKHITFKKLLNLGIIYIQHEFLKNSKVIGYPIRLVIEPTNICNLNCPLCYARSSNKELERGSMSFEDFKKIIDELKDYLFEIDLYNFGESLLNKDIYRMINYANKNNIKTNLSTNLHVVNIHELINSNLDNLILSIDGITQETYSRYRKGGNLNRVLNNLKKIIEQKKFLKKKNPKITWQFLVMRHNEHEIQELKKLTKKLKINLDVKPIRLDTAIDKEISENIRNKKKSWLPLDLKKIRKEYKTNKRPGPSSCIFIWNQAVVNWDGSVTPCCSIIDHKKYKLGDLKQEGSFMKVWNNKHYRNVREMVRKMKPNSDYEICSNCIKHGFVDV